MYTEFQRYMLAIHCTYPNHPSCAVDNVIDRRPMDRAPFRSIESAFRDFAAALGWNVAAARFCKRSGSFGGVKKDLSSLLIPGENGEHYRIAFYT